MEELIRKFRFKDTGVVLNAPPDLAKLFNDLKFKTVLPPMGASANTLVFINNNQEYLQFLKKDLGKIENDSVLWFAYPKGTSKIKTDINRDSIRTTGESYGITTVTAISINDTWSALRFRPVEKVGK